MDSLNASIWPCRFLCKRTKIWIFKTLVLPVLLYGCETWTLKSDLKERIDAFGITCLCRIIRYRWYYDFVSNRRSLCETASSPISCTARERQLRLYGHVASYLEVDPAHWVVSVRDNPVWRRPRGRSQLSWLEQVDESCQELLRMERGPAWRLARKNPRVWRRRVGDTTHPLRRMLPSTD